MLVPTLGRGGWSVAIAVIVGLIVGKTLGAPVGVGAAIALGVFTWALYPTMRPGGDPPPFGPRLRPGDGREDPKAEE